MNNVIFPVGEGLLAIAVGDTYAIAKKSGYSAEQVEAYATAMVREALELAAATVAKGINERSSLIANVTRRNAASEILALTQ